MVSKSKNKALKVELNSGSDSDDSEHELSYYMKDKVRLMKEVLKLIKPKKIKSMAPDCIKHLNIVEINSMLLEELLGISNKRLRYIFNGENIDRESSSSDSDEEAKSVDVISLDDISDDEIEFTPSEKCPHKRRRHHSHKIKEESPDKKPKLRFMESDDAKESESQKLLSVLELLELQARARAIKSQIALEAQNQTVKETVVKEEIDSDPDAVIIESPKPKEIVLSSSEDESNEKGETTVVITEDSSVISVNDSEKKETPKVDDEVIGTNKQKIKLIRNRYITDDKGQSHKNSDKSNCEEKSSIIQDDPNESSEPKNKSINEKSDCVDDEIVINLDEDEMKGIENDCAIEKKNNEVAKLKSKESDVIVLDDDEVTSKADNATLELKKQKLYSKVKHFRRKNVISENSKDDKVQAHECVDQQNNSEERLQVGGVMTELRAETDPNVSCEKPIIKDEIINENKEEHSNKQITEERDRVEIDDEIVINLDEDEMKGIENE